jgi:phosphatidylglycerol:prolipoprotein diacylglycerol transferase
MIQIIYPLVTISALVAGMWITESRCSDRNFSRKLYIVGVIGGILGARFFHSLVHGPDSAGLSAYGFALGAIPAFSAYYYWVNREWKDTDFLDALAPAAAFGVGLFRIGCYFAGCCFGTVCDLPWCVQYGTDSNAFFYQLNQGLLLPGDPNALPIHPVQLYESAISFCGLLLILLFSRRSHQPSHSQVLFQRENSDDNGIDSRYNFLGVLEWIGPQRYELFLGWIAYYGIWRIMSVPLRAGSGYFLAVDQAV